MNNEYLCPFDQLPVGWYVNLGVNRWRTATLRELINGMRDYLEGKWDNGGWQSVWYKS